MKSILTECWLKWLLGSALIELPQDQIEESYKATPWAFQQLMSGTRPLCTDFTDDWSVSFTIGTGAAQQTFSVKRSQLAQRGYQDDHHCFPPFNSWDSQKVILGRLCMKTFCSVFDFGSFDQDLYHMRVDLLRWRTNFYQWCELCKVRMRIYHPHKATYILSLLSHLIKYILSS